MRHALIFGLCSLVFACTPSQPILNPSSEAFLVAPNRVEAVFDQTGMSFLPVHDDWSVSFGRTSLGRDALTLQTKSATDH